MDNKNMIISDEKDEFVEAIENEEDLKKFRQQLERRPTRENRKGFSTKNTFIIKKDENFNNINNSGYSLSKDYCSNEEKFIASKNKIEKKIFKNNSSESLNLPETAKSFISSDKENEELPLSIQKMLDKKIRQIPVKANMVKERVFTNLYEAQIISADTDTLWTGKISYDNKYLAVGGKSGVLKVWDISTTYSDTSLDKRNINAGKIFNLIEEESLREFSEHKKDIIDLSWAVNNNNLLLTGSLDHFIILWDISKENFIFKFDHMNIVTCVCFCPNNDDIFVSGSLDKIIRIFSIKKKKIIDYINVVDLITAISFSPCSGFIVSGYHNGKCDVFSYENKLKLMYNFECRNKYGKFSNGRKVTSIDFLNKNEILIATNDSRLRVFNVKVYKRFYKGKKNRS